MVGFGALLNILVRDNNIGIGNSVNDLLQAISNGSAALPETSENFIPIETADGTALDGDDVGSGGNGINLINITATGNVSSLNPYISADGSRIAFDSNASNLILNDTNGTSDIFVYDVVGGGLVNITAAGNGHSSAPSVTGDGGKIVFESTADTLTPNDTNGVQDIFVYDLASGGFVNITAAGNDHSLNASISADGSKISFRSDADNFTENETNLATDIFIYDFAKGNFSNITETANGSSYDPVFTSDGSKLVFWSFASNLTSDDSNGMVGDVFLYDLASGSISNISAGGNGQSYRPSISADGSKIVFESEASNLVPDDTNGVPDIFIYDMASGSITNITSAANRISIQSLISADGSKIVFGSDASNLTPNDTNGASGIFVYDVASGGFTNITSTGSNFSGWQSVSADGSSIAFVSAASNLTSNDINGQWDVFLFEFA